MSEQPDQETTPAKRPTAKLPKVNPWILLGGAVVVLLWIWVWAWRPLGIIRGPFMLFWRHPALFTLPFITSFVCLGIYVAIRATLGDKYAKTEKSSYGYRSREDGELEYELRSFRGEAYAWGIPGLIAVTVASIFTGAWTAKAVYDHIRYNTLTPQMLAGANVRVKPYDVAQNQIDASLNSSTDHATNLRIVMVNGKLVWTAVRDPEGFVRSISHHSNGLISVDAQTSSPNAHQGGVSYTAPFKFGPGMKWSHSISWQIHKKCFTCDIAEITAMPTSTGPVYIVPYIKWEGGWFVKRPVFGGVYVVSPSGKMVNYSPGQALNIPLLVNSGRIFPEGLARRYADVYAYKKGLWNKLFTHTQQFDVADTGSNPQPYLEDFKNLGMQWVTTLKPAGSTFTTGGIMTTSALTGETRIWLTPPNNAYIGNTKAIEIVRGAPGLGVVFADPNATDAAGKFLAIEPRQIFPPGHTLQFLVSVVPFAETRVSLNVIVDAQQQSVAAVFQANPQGDADLINYLNTGQIALPSEQVGGGANTPTTIPVLPTTPTTGTGAVATLERLLQENAAAQKSSKSQLAGLQAQAKDLEQLLLLAQKTPAPKK
jgi:hypothetical protein